MGACAPPFDSRRRGSTHTFDTAVWDLSRSVWLSIIVDRFRLATITWIRQACATAELTSSNGLTTTLLLRRPSPTTTNRACREWLSDVFTGSSRVTKRRTSTLG